MTKLKVALHNFVNMPKIESYRKNSRMMWTGFIRLWTGTNYSFHNKQGTSSLAMEILASENNSAPWTQN